MKKIILFLALLAHFLVLYSQPLSVRGKIRCMNPTPETTKGAENIVVVPTFAPSRSSPTATFPSGYFEINTGLTFEKLQDKILVLQVISKCASCKESVRRIFVSEDQRTSIRSQQKSFITVKDWLLKTTCQQAELPPNKVDSITNIVIQKGGRDLNYMPGASVLTGTPALLNLLTSLTTAVGAGGISNIHYGIKALHPSKISYGDFLNASSMYHSANKGFNFSPARDMSEAVFWNPSSMAFSVKPGNISLLTNVKNNGKLAGYYKLNDKMSLGVGAIFTMQDEFRLAFFEQGSFTRSEDSMPMNLKEYAGYLSAAYKVNERLSGGLSIKYIGQAFNNPDSLFCDNEGKGTFIDEEIKNRKVDLDLSATYKFHPSFQMGINLMNLLGTELNTDAYASSALPKPVQNLRSAGIGFLYKYRRVHGGLDLLITENGLYDANLGINVVPFNNALISAGISLKQMAYNLSVRFKHFRIAYVDDNDYMVAEKRVGKSSILNGKIFGGFVFDVN